MCSASAQEGNAPLPCPASTVSHLIKGQHNVSEMSTKALEGDQISLNDYRDAFYADYYEELMKAVEANMRSGNRFFILVSRRQLPSAISHNVYRQTWIGCLLRPRAEANTDCWLVDANREELELQWSLPCTDTIKKIAKSCPDGVDEFLFTCCKEYLDGKLNSEHDRRIATEAATALRDAQGQIG